MDEEVQIPILEMNVVGYRRQVERLAEVRRTRDGRAVAVALRSLDAAARQENQNLMEPILAATAAYATLQEMMDVLRDVWGRYEEPVIV